MNEVNMKLECLKIALEIARETKLFFGHERYRDENDEDADFLNDINDVFEISEKVKEYACPSL